MCICFGGSKPIFENFKNSDKAGDLGGRKSTTGSMF